MSQHPNNSHYVRRVVLPSGKTIEVVYFDDQAVEAVEQPVETVVAPVVASAETGHDLQLCGGCGSDLVYPLDWEEAGTTHWEVDLRCPNCEWSNSGVFCQEDVERFDEELDRGTEAMVRDLKRLMHANMEDDIRRFVAALEGDHIVPDDF
jgi:hypothetical protein